MGLDAGNHGRLQGRNCAAPSCRAQLDSLALAVALHGDPQLATLARCFSLSPDLISPIDAGTRNFFALLLWVARRVKHHAPSLFNSQMSGASMQRSTAGAPSGSGHRTHVLAFVLSGLILSLLLGVAGCVAPATQSPAPATQPIAVSAQYIDNLKLDIADVVGGVIVTADNSGAEAKRIHRVATEMKQIASSDVDISDLRKLAVTLAAKQLPGRDRDKAVFFTNLAFNRLRRYTGIGSVTVIPADKLALARQILVAVSDGAIDGSEPFLD